MRIEIMKKLSFGALFLIILVSCNQKHESKQPELMKEKTAATDPIVKMENNSITLLVDLQGGAYFDFRLKDLPINPIGWKATKPEESMFKGQFVCFDRWGPPSAGEKANGFTHHGEASLQLWQLITPPAVKDGRMSGTMTCTLPMAGLQLTRNIEMSAGEPVFYITEEIKNLNKNGRLFNIVQHVTLAPPFLDKTTLFDNNTLQGFEDKENGSLNQEDTILTWPQTVHKGQKVSLRQFEGDWPRVASFVYNMNDKYGWVTACNPEKNLMLGYFYETKEYPWINFWRNMENGIPTAFGMEFGTSGLHEPLPIVAKKGKIFGQNIYEFIDASEVLSKSFTAFLAKIPSDYKGVERIEFNNSTFVIKEKAKVSRDITYHMKK